MAQRIRHINYKSDFSLIVTVPYLHGTATVLPEWDWWLTFKVGSVEKVFSQEGGVLSDGLKKVGDNKVEVFFDNHGFPTGTLVLEFSEKVPNTDYADGYKDTYAPQDLPIELWDSASDDYSPMAVNVYGSLEACVQNKVDKVDGKGLSTNDYTDAEKAKLGNLPDGIVYDTEIKNDSENAVQNNVIYSALLNKADNNWVQNIQDNLRGYTGDIYTKLNSKAESAWVSSIVSNLNTNYITSAKIAETYVTVDSLKSDYTTTADLQSNYYDKASCEHIFLSIEENTAQLQDIRTWLSGYVLITGFNNYLQSAEAYKTVSNSVDTINTKLANTETLTFTLEDGSVVTKTFVVSNTTTE